MTYSIEEVVFEHLKDGVLNFDILKLGSSSMAVERFKSDFSLKWVSNHSEDNVSFYFQYNDNPYHLMKLTLDNGKLTALLAPEYTFQDDLDIQVYQ